MTTPLTRSTLTLSLLLAACAAEAPTPDPELAAERAIDPDEIELDDEDLAPDVGEVADEELVLPLDARVIERAGVRAIAPPPGLTVHATVIFDDGSMSELEVATAADGTVTDRIPARPAIEEGDAARAAGAPRACDDTFWVGLLHRWGTRYGWKLNTATRPGNLGEAAVEGAVRRATLNITRATNSCDMPDRVGATQRYRGRTKRRAGITAAGGCTANDGVNVTDFGNLPADVLALTCTWHDGVRAVESDARMNKADHRWYVTKPDRCAGRYDVEAIMTHERGHTFGLADLSVENHGNLTMRGWMNTCDGRTRTLGKGDVLGLRNKY